MKYCKKCRKYYPDSQAFCDSCKGSLEQRSEKKKHKPILITLCVLALILIGVAVFLIVQRLTGSDDALQYDAEIAEKMEQVFKAAEAYEDSNGCVDAEDCTDAIDAVYKAACSESAVTNCVKDEYGVYIEVGNGPDYVYCPTIEGYDVGGNKLEIVTMQPYYTQNVEIDGSMDHDGLDTAAGKLAAADDRFSFDMQGNAKDDDVNDSEVTMERILSLDKYSVILWHGHGGYTKASGYYLCTNISYNESFCSSYGFINKGDLCIDSGGKVGLKPSFFQHNFEDGAFDNAFVYIGTCYSGTDPKLTEAFIDKGAAVVFSNSKSINRDYNLQMMHFISESFFCGATTETVSSAIDSLGYAVSLEPHQTWDVDMSLELAKLIYGEKDVSFFGAKVSYSLQPGVKRLTYSDWMEGFGLEAKSEPLTYKDIFSEELSWSGTKTFADDYSDTLDTSYRCPQLDTSKGNFEYVNSLIYDQYCRGLNSTSLNDGIINIDYRTGGSGDVVSILLKINYYHDYVEYGVYNVKISTGELLSTDEFLREIGCRDFRSRLAAEAGQQALDYTEGMDVPQEWITDMYNSTVSDENLSQARPLFVGDRLSAICPIYIYAGKGCYEYLIDLE